MSNDGTTLQEVLPTNYFAILWHREADPGEEIEVIPSPKSLRIGTKIYVPTQRSMYCSKVLHITAEEKSLNEDFESMKKKIEKRIRDEKEGARKSNELDMLRNEELEVDVYSPLPKWEDLAPKICMLTREKKPGETIDKPPALILSDDGETGALPSTVWCLVYHKDGVPGHEFQIYRERRLHSYESLRRGSLITLICGPHTIRGMLAYLTENREFLERNIQSIKMRFLKDLLYPNVQQRESYEKLVQHTDQLQKLEQHVGDGSNEYGETIKIYNEKTPSVKCEMHVLKYEEREIVNEGQRERNEARDSEQDISSPAESNRSSSPRSRNLKRRRRNYNLKGTRGRRNILRDIDENQNDDDNYDVVDEEESEVVYIGPHHTKVSKKVYDSIKWNEYSKATRILLEEIFGRTILATHTLTGKPSPAFKDMNKPRKEKLDPIKVKDIVETVSMMSSAEERHIRAAITTKCADATKESYLMQNTKNNKKSRASGESSRCRL